MADKRAGDINNNQADILASVLGMPFYKEERIPWCPPRPFPATWSAPLAGLIKRGFLKEYRRNMYVVTLMGEKAYSDWQAN